MPMIFINKIKDLKRISSDGIIGLGRKGDSEFNVSLTDILYDQKIIDKKIFSLYLTGQKCVGNSILTLGGYDTNLINGEVNYLDIVKDNMWAVGINGVTLEVDSKYKRELDIEAKYAVIDSGTTKITFSTKDL